ncbi:sigma-70 family RNA polymerase sigma factor [Thermosulfurimonas sp. F29]|uniref:sigma-70 family RNA polymerase sigma factor n=1 Tax=Thermosulfurimonas sp. F29 TaxID=2867247 RepID=UPI001C83BC38|nr:sigma-70 family RNA polymerase sigma factor [Thermosulfurimonas sp. F29]MBX6424163.1 sigma-70 family RNA polymerase sigma factor [Thermosulfurimonas sp. F29]
MSAMSETKDVREVRRRTHQRIAFIRRGLAEARRLTGAPEDVPPLVLLREARRKGGRAATVAKRVLSLAWRVALDNRSLAASYIRKRLERNWVAHDLVWDDLEQVALLALMEAALHADPGKGTFTTIAWHYLRQKFDREVLRAGLLLKLPPQALEKRNGANGFVHWLKQRSPDLILRVENVLTGRGILRLSQPLYEDDQAPFETVFTGNGVSGGNGASGFDFGNNESDVSELLSDLRSDPEEEAAAREKRRIVALALRELPPRWREVILLRLEGCTLAEIGRKMGISRERVRQIEKRAVQRIRAKLRRTAVRCLERPSA